MVIKTVRVNGVVEIPQEVGTVARDEVNSCDFALLKCLPGIESVAE